MSKIKIKVKAADYTVVDSDYDLLHKGCVRVDPERTVKYLYSHDKKEVLGNVIKWWDEDDGLYCEVELADPAEVPLVKRALYEMENGLVDKNSIGFKYIYYKYNEMGFFDVTDIELFEVSMVSIPSNPKTPYLGKIEDSKEEHNSESDLSEAIEGLMNVITSLTN